MTVGASVCVSVGASVCVSVGASVCVYRCMHLEQSLGTRFCALKKYFYYYYYLTVISILLCKHWYTRICSANDGGPAGHQYFTVKQWQIDSHEYFAMQTMAD